MTTQTMVDFFAIGIMLAANMSTILFVVTDFFVASSRKTDFVKEEFDDHFFADEEKITIRASAFSALEEFALVRRILKQLEIHQNASLVLESDGAIFGLGRPNGREKIRMNDFLRSPFGHLARDCVFGRVMFLVFCRKF